MDKNHIIEKIRKLMSLQESAKELGNEGEANAAAAGITRLLVEYNLAMDDIHDAEIHSPIDIEYIDMHINYITSGGWFSDLLNVLCKHNRCLHLRTVGSRNSRHSIAGRIENRKVVLYLLSFLCEKFIRIGRKNYPEWKYRHILRTGMVPPTLATYMKSFLTGCVWGLNDKLEAEMEVFGSEKITALTRNYIDEIENYLKQNIDLVEKKKRQQNYKLNSEILKDGIETGRTIKIHQGIETKDNAQNKIIK